jgi:hypothetical protein
MLDADFGQHAELSQRYKSGANWFYWIAGFSMITSVIGLLGGGWRFFLSLGTTQIIDAFANVLAAELGDATKVIALVLDIFVTGAFAGFGLLANKRHFWAYIVGMVVFFLDGLVSLAFFDWIGIIVHVLVLYWMFRGFQAGRELVSLEKAMAQSVPEPQPSY